MTTTQKIHHYQDSVKIEKAANEAANAFLIQKLSPFYKIERIRNVEEKQLQFAGIDKIVTTLNAGILRVEEKIRTITRKDILIELVSNDTKYLKAPNALGWGLRDYNTDILSYFFADSRTGYIYSYKKFKKTLYDNLFEWYKLAEKRQYGFGIFKAKNERYSSINIAVPINAFNSAYKQNGGIIL